MDYQSNVTSVRSRISRRIQVAFVAGLLLGIMLGWLFSGVVSAVMRFGLLVVLLIPLVLALLFWWRVRRTPANEPTVITWSSLGSTQNLDDLFGPTTQRPVDPDEIVIELEELKRDRRP